MNNPFRPDPFTLFGGYPTRHIDADWSVTLEPGMTWAQAKPLLESPLVSDCGFNRPTMPEVEQILAWLTQHPVAAVKDLLETFPVVRRPFLGRGRLWLARFGIIVLRPSA